VQEQLRHSSMRLVGPNCLGIMNPAIGLNATFAKDSPKAGNVAFLSQSGALLTAILDWSQREQVGFSAIVSTGSMLDIGWGDLIYYFGDDPRTKSILLYMESVGDARSFVSAAREVALSKPIIVIKAGRSPAGSRAAASHTGALTGNDEVLEAAFRRSGVLRVHNVADLFYMAEVLGRQPRPKGPRLTIVTNAGGPGVLATDALAANDGELAELSTESLQRLDEFLPAHWSHNNPIDILGDADSERYARAIEIASQDSNSDGLLVILAPQGMTDPLQVAERLRPYAKLYGKPVLASWMGGDAVAAGEAELNAAGIPTFPYPDTAARAFTYMWRYTYNLRGLYETPTLTDPSEFESSSRNQAAQIVQNARQQGRVSLNEAEAKQLLSLYNIPTAEKLTASQQQIGTGGYQLILGSRIDSQFGPVILFGSGGQLVDAYGDRALALPPLNTTLAQRMMEQTRVFAALKGIHGRECVNVAALENLLVRFSQLVLEQRWIAEIEINPLFASPEHLLALNTKILLHGPGVTLDQLPKPAIRPYPLQYVSTWKMKDGNEVTIRPIRPEDEPLLVKFHETLSDRSVYLRYFATLTLSRRVAHERLLRICFGDYDREMVLVAERTDPATGERRILGVGRMNKLRVRNEAEVAALVSDQYQKMGLGRELLRRVVEIARDEKIGTVSAEMLPDNIAMQAVFRRLGFRICAGEDMSSLRALLEL
ncbi:MAG: GNAT family N-acetyltransferase, partial [Terriglobales bacterium]